MIDPPPASPDMACPATAKCAALVFLASIQLGLAVRFERILEAHEVLRANLGSDGASDVC